VFLTIILNTENQLGANFQACQCGEISMVDLYYGKIVCIMLKNTIKIYFVRLFNFFEKSPTMNIIKEGNFG
jgi:hypothetical protein